MLRCFRLDSSRTNRRARSKSGPLDKAQGGRVWGLRHPSSLRSGRATLPPPRYIVGDTYWSRLTASRSRTASHKVPKNRPRARPHLLACPRLVVSPRPVRATGSRSEAMSPFFGGRDGHERCLEVAHTAPSSEPHSRPNRRPGAAVAAPPQLACAQQSARCGGRLGVYYTFWRVSGAGPSTSCPAGTHMLPGEQGSGVCAKSGVLKQARRAPTAGFERSKNRSRPKHKSKQASRKKVWIQRSQN